MYVVTSCWLPYISWFVWFIILRECAGRVSADGVRDRVSFIIARLSMLPRTLSQIRFLKINLFIWTNWQVFTYMFLYHKRHAINLVPLWFCFFWLGKSGRERVRCGYNQLSSEIFSCSAWVWMCLHLEIIDIFYVLVSYLFNLTSYC